MKKGAATAKGKKQTRKREHTKALSKLARAERKAERKVAELRALLVKAEQKLAKHAARGAALVGGVIAKHDASADVSPPPPVPVALEPSAPESTTPAATPYKGERDIPASAPAPKRSTARSIKSTTAPAPTARRAAPNHTARKGNQIEAPTPGGKEGDDE